jgi:hypothetical protein
MRYRASQYRWRDSGSLEGLGIVGGTRDRWRDSGLLEGLEESDYTNIYENQLSSRMIRLPLTTTRRGHGWDENDT